MFNADDLLKLIKKTAVDAVNASKPANAVFGKVISVSPLQIKVDQKLILTSAQLVLSRNVTDHTVSVEVEWETEIERATQVDEIAGTETTESGISFTDVEHKHKVKGTKEMIIYNALKTDDEVILMQMSGGQKYIVIDRIGKG